MARVQTSIHLREDLQAGHVRWLAPRVMVRTAHRRHPLLRSLTVRRGPGDPACRPWRPRRPRCMGFRLTHQTTDGSVLPILGFWLGFLAGPVVTSPLSFAAAGRALFPTSNRVKFGRIAGEVNDRHVIPHPHFQSL